MLNVGDKAPEFTLPNQEGESVSLSDFEGKQVDLGQRGVFLKTPDGKQG